MIIITMIIIVIIIISIIIVIVVTIFIIIAIFIISTKSIVHSFHGVLTSRGHWFVFQVQRPFAVWGDDSGLCVRGSVNNDGTSLVGHEAHHYDP